MIRVLSLLRQKHDYNYVSGLRQVNCLEGTRPLPKSIGEDMTYVT